MINQLVSILKELGIVTSEIQSRYFKGCGFGEIRNWLEENGLDRHMCLELSSTELAIKTPNGLLEQRSLADNGKLGFWGGVTRIGETPEECITRELKEETGLDINITTENFVETSTHIHHYENGDTALFHTHRYVLKLDYDPSIRLDEESIGVEYITRVDERVIYHQRKFANRVLSTM